MANKSTGDHYLSKARQLSNNLCTNRWQIVARHVLAGLPPKMLELIHQFYDLTTNWLRTRPSAIHLVNKCRVRTRILQSLILINFLLNIILTFNFFISIILKVCCELVFHQTSSGKSSWAILWWSQMTLCQAQYIDPCIYYKLMCNLTIYEVKITSLRRNIKIWRH